MPTQLRALLIFSLTPLIWGATFPIIKSALEFMSPTSFVFVRFLLACLLMLPLLTFKRRLFPKQLVLSGALLGLLNMATFYTQTLGLLTITSSQSAFITAISVVLVPLLAWLVGSSRIKLSDLLSALLCMLGIYLLTGANFSGLGIGHGYTLITAISTALSILVIQRVSQQGLHLAHFSFLQIAFTALFMLPGELSLHETLPHFIQSISHANVVFALCYCAGLGTILALFIQTKYQKDIGECRAALVLTCEPLFASAFSLLFFNEPLSQPLIFGGLMILASLALSELWPVFMTQKTFAGHPPKTQ